MEVIDFRSDTVTRPSGRMRELMSNAIVGDDVYREDPSVNGLESLAADMFKKDSGLFLPSGTQSNLVALMSHCERGDEYIVGQQGHTYKYEGGGAAVLGSIQPQPLDYELDGTLNLEKVRSVIKPSDSHFANTRLLCLENTHAGKALPPDYLVQASKFCKDNALNLHLDGARIFNAAVRQGLSVSKLCEGFDTVSVCLSKGLGAPVGSILCGRADLLDKARRWRKLLGGGMRQAGVLASCGIYALKHNVDRLVDDHENAAFLAEELSSLNEIEVVNEGMSTNMVFLKIPQGVSEFLVRYMQEKKILIGSVYGLIRLVTHMDVNKQDVQRLVLELKQFFSGVYKKNN